MNDKGGLGLSLVIIGVILVIGIGIGVFYFSNDSLGAKSVSALAPYVEFEATVISLSLEDSESYFEGNEIETAPRDTALIRIDKMIATGGGLKDWSSIGIEEGSEAQIDFKYTVRPTKIITVVGETTESGGGVSHTIVPTEISFEEGYFIFRINGNSETETILPGLQEGSKFKTKLWSAFGFGEKIDEYEIIN